MRNHLADTTAEGDRPLLAAVGLPIGGDDGRARQVPPAGADVIDDVLSQEEIDIGAIVVTDHRPDVADQDSDPLSAKFGLCPELPLSALSVALETPAKREMKVDALSQPIVLDTKEPDTSANPFRLDL